MPLSIKCMAKVCRKLWNNIVHLRIWKNIENKPVTCCKLVDFLYAASVAGKQFGTEY